MTSPISFRSTSGSGLSLLLAHDQRSGACDHLIERVATIASASERRLGLGQSLHLEELGSLEAGWVALERAARQSSPSQRALVLACLDLPPAPRAGATLATWATALALPVVVVAHSRRWLPLGESVLSTLPVLSPTADDAEIAAALSSALSSPTRGGFGPGALGPALLDPEEFPSRPSWLG